MSKQRFAELGEIRDGEGGVSLFGRLKGGFDADMELLIAALEPAAAACSS